MRRRVEGLLEGLVMNRICYELCDVLGTCP